MQILSIFFQFFTLGLTSFGGPAAHLGYFRNHFVEKKQWLKEDEYAQLIALSQFLPGPGSSQVGFALGYNRAGLFGGIAAFVGFTLPSFAIMLSIALFSFSQEGVFSGVITGLKLLAVVVVVDAVLSMSKSFCQTNHAKIMTLLSACAVLVIPHLVTQVAVILVAGAYGYYINRTDNSAQANSPAPSKTSFVKPKVIPILLFVGLWLTLFLPNNPIVNLFGQFYSAGSLVFGGGHVVLPVLQHSLTDIDPDRFLLGYSSAQGIPGPMFAIATFLGAEQYTQQPLVGAIVATIAIFLPGFLLVIAILPSWNSLAENTKFKAAVSMINASVVGLLLSALYNPVFVTAVTSSIKLALVLAGLLVLRLLKVSVLWLLVVYAVIGQFL